MRWLFLFVLVLSLFAAPKVMLLKRYHDQNITGWVMSEKLDGVRAYWDGKMLWSRGGKVIVAPGWFLKQLPPFAVDGELWTKRGDFSHIVSIVRKKRPSKEWRQIGYYIFDVPDAKGDLFERLKKVKPYEGKVVHIIKQYPIASKANLMEFFHQVVQKGGEGVVVCDPKATYERKRSKKIFKLKPMWDDECEVIGYEEGKGRLQGKVGTLVCKKDGRVFKIGSGLSNELRSNPPAIGSIVTYQYTGLTKHGLPRFPRFLRVKDVLK